MGSISRYRTLFCCCVLFSRAWLFNLTVYYILAAKRATCLCARSRFSNAAVLRLVRLRWYRRVDYAGKRVIMSDTKTHFGSKFVASPRRTYWCFCGITVWWVVQSGCCLVSIFVLVNLCIYLCLGFIAWWCGLSTHPGSLFVVLILSWVLLSNRRDLFNIRPFYAYVWSWCVCLSLSLFIIGFAENSWIRWHFIVVGRYLYVHPYSHAKGIAKSNFNLHRTPLTFGT